MFMSYKAPQKDVPYVRPSVGRSVTPSHFRRFRRSLTPSTQNKHGRLTEEWSNRRTNIPCDRDPSMRLNNLSRWTMNTQPDSRVARRKVIYSWVGNWLFFHWLTDCFVPQPPILSHSLSLDSFIFQTKKYSALSSNEPSNAQLWFWQTWTELLYGAFF